MKPLTIAAVVLITATSRSLAQQAKEAPKQYIGEVIIVGNTITHYGLIESVAGLTTGQKLVYPELKLAERNLARLGIFKGRPTVTVLESKGPFQDILVKVEEGGNSSFRPELTIAPGAGPAFALEFEDRNIDLLGLPRSIFDFRDGRAFHGAGQRLRVGIAIGLLLEPRLLFSLTSINHMQTQSLLADELRTLPAPIPFGPRVPAATP